MKMHRSDRYQLSKAACRKMVRETRRLLRIHCRKRGARRMGINNGFIMNKIVPPREYAAWLVRRYG